MEIEYQLTMSHDNLTIVSVYGHNDGASAIPAIQKSVKELPGSQGMLLSIEKPENLPDDIIWHRIGFLDYMMYSVFIMHSLYAFIDTDYCLIVQDDSWVLNGANFKPEYYEYDYIGGVSHAAMVGNQLLLQGSWHDKFPRTLVQNGGFSLRSKRFLEAPNRYGIVHNHAQDIHLWNEDVQLSCLKRHIFAELGMKYASEKTIRDFSIENVIPTFHDNFDFGKLLGCHSTSRKLVSDTHILVNPICVTSHREPDFLSFLQSIGYTIEYVASNNPQA
jgi:hypothetical protein